CRFLLDHPSIATSAERVAAIDSGDNARVTLTSGGVLESDALVICTAGATTSFDGLGWLPLRTVRGQVTFCRATAASMQWQQAHCHTGYLTPAFDGVHCIGATFDRERQKALIDHADDQANLAELEHGAPELWQALGGKHIEVVG